MNRCPAVEDLLKRLYEGLRAADLEAVLDLFARNPETLLIGTDPGEWWAGEAALDEALTDLLGSSGGLELLAGEPRAFESGDVAWSSDRPVFELPSGGTIPVRVTAVAQRDGNLWRFVQVHLSVGIANDIPPEVVAITSGRRNEDLSLDLPH